MVILHRSPSSGDSGGDFGSWFFSGPTCSISPGVHHVPFPMQTAYDANPDDLDRNRATASRAAEGPERFGLHEAADLPFTRPGPENQIAMAADAQRWSQYVQCDRMRPRVFQDVDPGFSKGRLPP